MIFSDAFERSLLSIGERCISCSASVNSFSRVMPKRDNSFSRHRAPLPRETTVLPPAMNDLKRITPSFDFDGIFVHLFKSWYRRVLAAVPILRSYLPRSRTSTFLPFLLSSLASVAPPAPEPTIVYSYVLVSIDRIQEEHTAQ